MSPISDANDDGIGTTGVVSILFGTALHFVVFMGLSQMVKLFIGLDEKASAAVRRLGEAAVVLAELKTGQMKTTEQVRMVGKIVYDEANR